MSQFLICLSILLLNYFATVDANPFFSIVLPCGKQGVVPIELKAGFDSWNFCSQWWHVGKMETSLTPVSVQVNFSQLGKASVLCCTTDWYEEGLMH